MFAKDEDFSGLTETARVYTAKTLLSALKPAKTGKREAIRVCGFSRSRDEANWCEGAKGIQGLGTVLNAMPRQVMRSWTWCEKAAPPSRSRT
jgi:hypothetical protein